MSIQVVEGATALEAWRAGCAVLLTSRGAVSNLITTIAHPCAMDDQWLAQHSPRWFKAGANDARDVANTLFPQKTYERAANRPDLYLQYLKAHDRTHKWRRGRNAWGTYFERLIRFPPTGVNQLERAIEKLNTWTHRNTTGLVFHLSSPAIDSPRTRGGPCWHFGEIIWNADSSLDLVVVYRNHDFFNKVLGNFVGLGRLLRFICSSTDKQPGKIICHSVHAYTDGSHQQLRLLMQ